MHTREIHEQETETETSHENVNAETTIWDKYTKLPNQNPVSHIYQNVSLYI